MFFKKDTPTTHRLWFVFATTFTVKALLDVKDSAPTAFVWAAVFWSITIYLWLLRRKWRLMSADGISAHYGAVDRIIQPFQSKFEQASPAIKVAYWSVIVLAAIGIYVVLSR